MNVRHPGIEKAVEAFDETINLDLQMIGADNGPVNGRIQSRCVASGCENANSLHLKIFAFEDWIRLTPTFNMERIAQMIKRPVDMYMLRSMASIQKLIPSHYSA